MSGRNQATARGLFPSWRSTRAHCLIANLRREELANEYPVTGPIDIAKLATNISTATSVMYPAHRRYPSSRRPQRSLPRCHHDRQPDNERRATTKAIDVPNGDERRQDVDDTHDDRRDDGSSGRSEASIREDLRRELHDRVDASEDLTNRKHDHRGRGPIGAWETEPPATKAAVRPESRRVRRQRHPDRCRVPSRPGVR